MALAVPQVVDVDRGAARRLFYRVVEDALRPDRLPELVDAEDERDQQRPDERELDRVGGATLVPAERGERSERAMERDGSSCAKARAAPDNKTLTEGAGFSAAFEAKRPLAESVLSGRRTLPSRKPRMISTAWP